MIVFGACIVRLYLHHLALYAISLPAVFAQFGAFLFPLAEGASVKLVDAVTIPQMTPARALVVDVGYQLFGLRLVGVLRKVAVAGLAEDEIAVCVVISSLVA